MPAKKKGPAFDMDSAFSGLFSVTPEPAKEEEVPAPEAAPAPDPEPAPVMTEPEAVLPDEEPVVFHRKAEDERTRQYTITLKKHTHEELRDIAWYTRQSVSSILNQLADEYIRQHMEELNECRKITRR